MTSLNLNDISYEVFELYVSNEYDPFTVVTMYQHRSYCYIDDGVIYFREEKFEMDEKEKYEKLLNSINEEW